MGDVTGRREACQAFGRAPNLQVAGSPMAPSFNEDVKVDLLFAGNVIALHATDLQSKYSLLVLGEPAGSPGRLPGIADPAFLAPAADSDGCRRGTETWNSVGLLYEAQFPSSAQGYGRPLLDAGAAAWLSA